MNRFIFICLFIFATSISRVAEAKNTYTVEEIEKMTAEDRIQAIEKIVNNRLATLDPVTRKEAAFQLLRFEPYLDDFPKTKCGIYRILSSELSGSGAFILSAEYQKLALNIMESQEPDRVFDAILGGIAWDYHHAGLADSALLYIRRSIVDLASTTASALNSAGMLYQELALDSAWYFYELAIDKLLSPKEMFLTNIQDNMAAYKYEQSLYQEALQLHQANLDFLNQNDFYHKQSSIEKVLFRKTKALFGLVECQLALNQVKAAGQNLHIIQRNFEQLTHTQFKARLIKPYYQLQIAYNDRVQNHQRKAQFLASSLKYEQAKILEEDEANKYAFQVLFDRKRTTFEKELELQRSIAHEKEQKLQFQRWQLYGLFFVLGPMLIMGLLLYRRQLKAKKQELEIQRVNSQLREAEAEKIELEKRQISESLRQTEKDLLDMSTYLSDNQTWTNAFIAQLENLAACKNTNPDDLKTLVKDIKTRLQVNERMNLVYENIDKVNHSFYHMLDQKFPALTEVEKEICGLIRLKLSNKDIAIYRNVSPQAVKMNRYRLRKKFELSPDINLYRFLKDLEVEVHQEYST